MTPGPQQQTITPERQIAASQIGSIFNSLHEYLRTLEHKDEEGRALLTKHLEFAHQRIDEAAMWAIKHVLTYGQPPAPKPAEAPPGAPAPAANDTPAPIGAIDPPQTVAALVTTDETGAVVVTPAEAASLPTDNGGTPSESV